MPRQVRAAPKGVLPPWLWFWLVAYLLALPGQAKYLWLPMLSEVFSRSPQPGEALIPFSFFLRFSVFAEVLPFMLLALGVVTIFLPQWCIRKIQREYNLEEPLDIPVIGGIRKFLSQAAPDIVIKVNLLRTDQLAFVYPLGYRATGIALFGGIVKLWRRDCKAAETVLLHEVAHVRQGDALVVRAGNFFETLLNVWLPLAAALVILPTILIWGYDAVRFIASDTSLIPVGKGIGYKFDQLLTLFLPGLLLTLLGLLFRTASILILPLIGIWCAELGADRFAINARGTPDSFLQGTASLVQPTSWGRWLVSQMSHPPNEIRRWLALRAAKPIGTVLPIGLFPLAYLVQLVLMLAWALSGYVMTRPAGGIGQALIQNARVYLQGNAPEFGAMAALLLFWPWLAGYWERIFCRANGRSPNRIRGERDE